MNCTVLILAGGSFTRMNGINKQLMSIGGIPVIIKSALAFERAESVDDIIIAAREADITFIKILCEKYGITKLKAIVKGGDTRSRSARIAFEAAGITEKNAVVAVHDGARPFVTNKVIEDVIAAAAEYGAAAPAIPVNDTVKFTDGGFAAGTPERASLRLIQTPQAFTADIYDKITLGGGEATDDAGLAEKAGYRVKLVDGDRNNKKITTPDDVFGRPDTPLYAHPEHKSAFAPPRIGHGYDVHRLAEGRELILGGVKIPYELGLLGHSDADVLVHAIMDALLGALALGDIGKHFPDTDPKYKGADSMELLRHVSELVYSSGCRISSLDATIIAEKPKLAGFIPKMRENIACACGCDISGISVKATTEEGLGLSGKGIAAHSVCILCEQETHGAGTELYFHPEL